MLCIYISRSLSLSHYPPLFVSFSFSAFLLEPLLSDDKNRSASNYHHCSSSHWIRNVVVVDVAVVSQWSQLELLNDYLSQTKPMAWITSLDLLWIAIDYVGAPFGCVWQQQKLD